VGRYGVARYGEDTYGGEPPEVARYGWGRYGIDLYGTPPGTILVRRVYDRLLPPYHARSGLLWAVLSAISDEVALAQAVFADIRDQANAWSATWTLDRWERELGLPVSPQRSDAQRQAIASGRRQGLGMPPGVYLERVARDVLDDTVLPTTYLIRPRVFVYKRATRGWPGDEAFQAGQARLRVSGRASGGFWLAPWNELIGLTYGQVNQMAYAAVNVLTYREVNGP
jgi:hypothetical protein